MKKSMALLSLALLSAALLTTAPAQTAPRVPGWSYATLAVWDTAQEKNYFWSTPDLEGVAANTRGTTLDEINTKSNCNVKPVGQYVLNLYDLFNCFGSRGWELVGVSSERLSVLTVTNYWFKRPLR